MKRVAPSLLRHLACGAFPRRSVSPAAPGARSVLVLGAIALMCAPLGTLGGCDFCGNEIHRVVFSPDHALKAIVFQRDCGASTGFSTQVSIVAAETPLPNAEGNLFIADDNHGAAPTETWGGPIVGVRWRDARTIVLDYHAKANVYSAEPSVTLPLVHVPGGSLVGFLASRVAESCFPCTVHAVYQVQPPAPKAAAGRTSRVN